jgi:hypothetical protein
MHIPIFLPKFRLFCLVVLLFQARLHAQSTVDLVLSQPFYVAGEYVQYSLLLPTPALKQEGGKIGVTLLTDQGQTFDQQYLAIGKKNTLNGIFPIPVQIATGMYYLLVTAVDEPGKVQVLTQAPVPVYNDLKPLPANLPEAATTVPSTNNQPFQIEMTTLPTQLGEKRQQVTVRVQVKTPTGSPLPASGALRVFDASLFGENDCLFRGNLLTETISFSPKIVKTGAVTNLKHQPVTTPLLVFNPLKTNRLEFGKSDEKGHFVVGLNEFYTQQPWQVLLQRGEPIQLTWDNYANYISRQPLTMSPRIQAYLMAANQRKAIGQEIPMEVKWTPAVPKETTVPAINWPTKRSFQVQNYESFPSMAEFMHEVTQIVRYNTQKNPYRANMYNLEQDREFETSPLFLLDGKATFDADFIGRLSPDQVESVDVLYGTKLLRQYYPALGAGGVISLRSRKSNLNLPATEANAITSLYGMAPDWVRNDPAGLSMPVLLRPLIAWDGQWVTNAQGIGQVEFTTSDDQSRYCVELTLKDEQGRVAVQRYCFEVR